MMNVKKLLPIGSVVKLKDAGKHVMISGILMENGGVKFDYICVPYPEGYIDQNRMFLFNHEDIDQVLFLGYINAEYQIFRGTLAKSYKSEIR